MQMISGFLITLFVIKVSDDFFVYESLHSIEGLNKFKLERSTSFLTADKMHRIALFEKAES